MNHRTLAAAAIAASLALPLSANAAPRRTSDSGSDRFSVTTGETVATNRDMVSAEAGFPGFTFGYTHGMNDHFDAGLKLDLLYGHRFTTVQSQFGMGLHAPLRLVTYRQNRVSVMLHADPGLDFYTAPGNPPVCAAFGINCAPGAAFGIDLPVGITVGYQATPEVRIAAGADLPLIFAVSPSPAHLQIGPMFGGAVEYYFERQWAVGFNVRFGPQFYTYSNSSAQLGFVTEATLGYRL